MCGKNFDLLAADAVHLGSPPRVREKPATVIDVQCNAGITPACAGKTDLIRKAFINGRDHPRVCGKNTSKSVELGEWPGSPPRVREKLRQEMIDLERKWITPACAGKTG